MVINSLNETKLITMAVKKYWIELPLYYFNFNNSIRFELIGREKNEFLILDFIRKLYDDLFLSEYIYLFVYNNKKSKEVELANYGIEANKVFETNWLKSRSYEITKDSHDKGIKFKNIIYKVNKNSFNINNLFFWNFKKGLQDAPGIILGDVNNQVFFDLYDDRGCDVVSDKKDFLQKIYEKYSYWISEYNRKEIQNKLNIR